MRPGMRVSMRNMSARHWIQLNFGSDIPDSEILEMVRGRTL